VKTYPAIDLDGELDLIYAALDDFSPSAVEERGAGVRAFFVSVDMRDAALAALRGQFSASPIDVPDEDWARRSQANLRPITVGRIVVSPPWTADVPVPSGTIRLIIQPSMGFGTGHHATTRLCLAALQSRDLENAHVLDVGTGSGVLAIAARSLGAAAATGIDSDPDAIQAARENLDLNPSVDRVTFTIVDLTTCHPEPADVVLANLTGALLIRSASILGHAVRPGGMLIISGFQTHERNDVINAFAPSNMVFEQVEDEWVGAALSV